MNRVAVVKPDHLGDYILSIPALRALEREFGTYDLYAAPGNQFLHEFFFPSGPTFRRTRLDYLQKDGEGEQVSAFAERLYPYDLIIFLRDDWFCHQAAQILGQRAVVPIGDHLTHETRIHQAAVESVAGRYSRTRLMWPLDRPQWPGSIKTIGISLSAGFFANKIPVFCWMQLAHILMGRYGIRVKLIGGPLETDELAMMRRLLRLGDAEVITGGSRLDAFYDRIGECDVIVGADSGTLHLVSVRVPVLGIFTSSPWRRFCPLGRWNRVLYAPVPCSPCIQFSKKAFNGCMSRECAALIEPGDIERALFASSNAGFAAENSRLRMVFGPSHV